MDEEESAAAKKQLTYELTSSTEEAQRIIEQGNYLAQLVLTAAVKEAVAIAAIADREREEMDGLSARFRAETTLANHNNQRQAGVVELNVGGTHFTTTQETLTASGSAYFNAMFSGLWEVGSGAIFIDRDPELFSIILRYMRAGCCQKLLVSIIETYAGCDKKYNSPLAIGLYLEADFFQIPSMIDVLVPKYHRPY